MELHENPLLKPENYAAEYQKSIEKMRNDPSAVAYDKLCYEVFEATEMGRKFVEFATDRFIINSQIAKGAATYQIDVIWQEGFRDFLRMVMNHVQSHKQRIAAGKS